MAFDGIEPFGDIRADYRQAITSAVIANANRPKGKAAYRIKQFLPVKPPAKPQTVEDMKFILKQIANE